MCKKHIEIRPWSTGARFTLYVVLPLVVPVSLVLMYFSGVPALQHIVSPCIQGVPLNSQREFGLLENLQNLCLLTIIAVTIAGALRKERRLEKALFAGIALFTVFMLLEEIDYGLHLYEMAHGWEVEPAVPLRNVHNTYELTDIMKNAAVVIMVVLFVILPLACRNSSRAVLRYIAADRLVLATMACMFVTRTLAHQLKDWGVGDYGTIHNNLSEFRELTTYYIFIPYLADIVFRRRFLPAPAEAVSRASTRKSL